MKVKKGKQFRKALSFYRIHYNFHSPYKVIVDGNLLKACMDANYDIKARFEKLSGGKCLLSTTSCITNEINTLGDQFHSLFVAARRLRRENCKHVNGPTDPATCIKALIGHDNSDHIMIATQDGDLCQHLEEIGNVPILTFTNSTLQIKEPAEKTLEILEREEKTKAEPTKEELKVLRPVIKKMRINERKKEISKILKQRKKLNIKLKKGAKGPNPKSIMKKRKPREKVSE